MADNRPIGMMDSGLGGVTVLKEARKILPEESFCFFGDNAFAPYGDKSLQEIHDRAMACAEKLIEQDVKAIVIACNTATSAAIDDMRKHFSLPVISMEPAIKPALESSGRNTVLMMATAATCRLERYQALKERIDLDKRVIDLPCTDLVACIESDLFEKGAASEILEKVLSKFNGEIIDAIVLGCTHFPIIEDEIKDYADKHFNGEAKIFDGRSGTVKQLKRVLEKNKLSADGSKPARISLHTSAEEELYLPKMLKILEKL